MSRAEATRLAILQKAFELIYRNGFQTTSIDTIIATMQVTKGAFFYHFKNKEEMGIALIQELIKPAIEESFVKPLAKSIHPADDIYMMMEHLLLANPAFQVEYGCPAVNLSSELATASDALRTALIQVMRHCVRAISDSIRQGQALGHIKKEVVPEQVADFIMTGYSGIRNMGKLFGESCYHMYLRELKRYLSQLA